MSESIVLISRHRVRPGKLDELMQAWAQVQPQIEASKPGTVLFHSYLNEAGTEVSFVHVFPDAEAMDAHFQGATQRAEKAYEMMEPQAYDVYGHASDAALDVLKQEAARFKMALTVQPQSLGGFLRLAAGA